MASIVNRVLPDTLDNQTTTTAKEKRLLLSEVYVHKRSKLATISNELDSFEVFHIFEIVDCGSQVIPKLSTNCSQPEQIINVLKNFTGSDTPQLKRLIDKLCIQHEKGIENRKKTKRIRSENGLDIESNREMETVQYSHPNGPRKPDSPPTSNEHGDDEANLIHRFIRPKPIESLLSKPDTISGEATPNEQTDIAQSNGNTNESIRLWNNLICRPKNNIDESCDLLVVNGTNETVQSLDSKEAEPLSTNGSSLKIGQVFGSVNDEFVENLLIGRTEKAKNTHQTQNRLIQTPENRNQNRIVNKSYIEKAKASTTNGHIIISKHEADFRCNFCLKSNEKFNELKEHLFMEHGFPFVCDVCFESFKFRGAYDSHRSGLSSSPCTGNATRPYICIVDPPVILLKNNQVHAFKCKHCRLAFFNQKNYVQHAQRHARTFRCKRCKSSKPISAEEMTLHLRSCDNNQ